MGIADRPHCQVSNAAEWLSAWAICQCVQLAGTASTLWIPHGEANVSGKILFIGGYRNANREIGFH